MKTLIAALLLTTAAIAAEQEGDLNLPVSDTTALDRQEQEEIPHLDEVPIRQKSAEDSAEPTFAEKSSPAQTPPPE